MLVAFRVSKFDSFPRSSANARHDLEGAHHGFQWGFDKGFQCDWDHTSSSMAFSCCLRLRRSWQTSMRTIASTPSWSPNLVRPWHKPKPFSQLDLLLLMQTTGTPMVSILGCPFEQPVWNWRPSLTMFWSARLKRDSQLCVLLTSMQRQIITELACNWFG